MLSDDEQLVKLASRSIPHMAGKTLTLAGLKSVIDDQRSLCITYRGFRFLLGDMVLQEWSKECIRFIYIKRVINDDYSTSALPV